jgi:hypothetical protein
MRFMMIVKSDKNSEAGIMPSAELVAAMDRFNKEMMDAGVFLSGEGLHPSAKGARVTFHRDGSRTVKEGPFAETKQLVAGFWMIQVKSKEEAIEWARRCPDPATGGDTSEIEIRQVFDLSDFPQELQDAAPHEASLRSR